MADLPDAATCYELLARMALIRRFEEEAGRQYQRAKAGGFLHLAIGEEATIVGTTSVMRDEDYLIGTYRTHGHAIARGTEPKRVMAELFGRVDGTSGGRGGSMHIFDRERRFMGGYGIVGGNLPIAAGLALSSEYKGEDAVTVCMFGDGASNTGNFGETMNLAALWKLPVLFLVENNLYGMGTSVERHSAQTDLSKKAEGYGIPGERIDGMDVIAVREGVAEGIRQAREERRPTLLEAFTYRYRGHSAADPEVYREREEVEEWREKDPIETFARRCVEAGVLGEREVQEVRDKAEETVKEAVEFADASPEPALDTLYENLYVVDQRGRLVRGRRAQPRAAPRRATRSTCPTRRASWPRRAPPTPASRTGRGPTRPSTATPRRESSPRSPKRAGLAGSRRGRGGRALMATLRMREALRDAMAEEMRRDEAVFVMGEDVGVFQGAFKVTEGLLDEFGERRVRDTPISENTIVGAGVGAAMGGLRPIVELMTVNFSLLALDQIVNHAAAIPYMFNGQARVPMVIRMPGGGGHQLGPTHSHSFEALYLQVPGLLVACPSTPADGKALLKAAIRDDNPVIFIEHESLYGRRGEVAEDGDGRGAALRRSGGAARGRRRDDRRHPQDGPRRRGRGADARPRARRRGRGDRPAHPAPARPRHDPRVGAQDQPRGDRRGGLAARRRRRQPGDADHRAGLRLPRRAGAAGDRRRRPHALLEAAGAGGDPARGARRAGGAGGAGGVDLMADIVMPRLSDSMEEGTVLQWLKRSGTRSRSATSWSKSRPTRRTWPTRATSPGR